MSFPLSGSPLGPTVNGNDINNPLSCWGNQVRAKVDENLSQSKPIFLQIQCNYKEGGLLHVCVHIYTYVYVLTHMYVICFCILVSNIRAGLCQ